LNYSASTTASPTLQQVDFKIGTKDECTSFWGSTYHHEYQMCGVIPGKSVCSVRYFSARNGFTEMFRINLFVILKFLNQGDSGGPIVRYSSGYQIYTQVGISSFVPASNGQALCEKGYAVFTRPSAHLDWINANSCLLADGGLCANWYYV
jgi:secreted trypsin-like serine protease